MNIGEHLQQLSGNDTKKFFHPHKALVVGSEGFPVEDFLNMVLELLFV